MSVYRLSEMPIQSCGRSASAPRRKVGARLSAHTELRSKRQRLAREAIYRNRPIDQCPPCKRALYTLIQEIRSGGGPCVMVAVATTFDMRRWSQEELKVIPTSHQPAPNILSP
jgi:hypothetical protein